MLTMSAGERRTRLMRRHRLAERAHASDELDAARAMLVLHATDPATVYLSVLARTPTATIESVAAALYDSRALVRMLAMRRTMFVVPAELVPVVHAAASLEVAARLRKQLVKELERGPTDPPLSGDIGGWLGEVEETVEQALARRGVASANQLAADEPRLRTAQLPTTDKAYDLRRNITTRVLTLMACEGRLVRGQPRGEWTSRHHSWEPSSRWWPRGIDPIDEAEARSQLVRRWLEVFGPARVSDIKWWTGWTLGATRAALATLDLADVDLDGEPGVVLADDVEPEAAAEPSAVLLPALDPTPMGWQQRDWFLGAHRERLFDRFGNIGPTVWWDGHVVGGWAIRADGGVVYRTLEDVGAEAAARIGTAAAELAVRLGDAVVVPSFRTPLERELSG